MLSSPNFLIYCYLSAHYDASIRNLGNIKKVGLEYEELNYDNCIDFLLMLPNSMKNTKE